MKKVFLVISLIIISVSCIRDVDYEQVETAIFSTPMSIALLHLEQNQHDFLDSNNNELSQVDKLFLIDLSEFFYESATDSLDYVTQFSNTFNRDFYCEFEFRDSDSLLIPITAPSFFIPATSTVPITDTITYTGKDFEQFISARWITVKVDLDNGTSIIPTENDNLEIQSVIHFNYEITPSS